jgi:type IV pilus assembly protein PilA
MAADSNRHGLVKSRVCRPIPSGMSTLGESRSPHQGTEGGFSLIEILVVLLIIAVLAAIAVPFFLRQREESYRAQIRASLKHVSIAMESHADANQGDYDTGPPTIPMLEDEEGFRPTAGVTVALVTVSDNSYCFQAQREGLDETWRYSSAEGQPTLGVCP